MSDSRKRLSAKEMMRLAEDPDLAAQRRQRQEEMARYHAELDAAEAPLVDDLRRAGLDVQSVWDLINRKDWYPTSIIPVLFQHLQKPYPDPILDGIARALATPAASFAWPVLVKLYDEQSPDCRTKQGLAVAMASMVTENRVDELSRIAADPRHGDSRNLLLEGFLHVPVSVARERLTELGKDKALENEVGRLLRRLSRRSSAGGRKPKPPRLGSVETSTNVDESSLEDLLKQIAAVLHVQPAQVRGLLDALLDLDIGEVGSFELDAGRGKKKALVHVNVLRRDPEALDVYFFAPPAMVDEITRVMHQYFDALGL